MEVISFGEIFSSFQGVPLAFRLQQFLEILVIGVLEAFL
jgi:ABC-type uncharacterized transport system permease subunit